MAIYRKRDGRLCLHVNGDFSNGIRFLRKTVTSMLSTAGCISYTTAGGTRRLASGNELAPVPLSQRR